jgi:uncharacterized membrane protein
VANPSRRSYIDWLRGIAVVSMIEWHVFDAWTLHSARDHAAWSAIKVIGGFAAPLFLFLAGVAVPMALAAGERRGLSRHQAAWNVQKRGWQVFGLAHLFRLQSFLFNPNARWSGLLKPDILNILGLGLAGSSFLMGRATAPAKRWLWLLLPALLIVALTPLSRMWWWPTLLHPRLEAYIRPVGNFGVFSLFPWVAYVPLGAYIGAWLLDAADEAAERKTLVRLFVSGAIATAAGTAASFLAPLIGVASWTDHAAVFFIKSGCMTMALGAARWLTSLQPLSVLEPMLLLGRTSLFVYWVHVEVAYGVVSYPLHYALPLAWSAAGFVAVLLLMYKAAGWWALRPGAAWIPQHLRTSS